MRRLDGIGVHFSRREHSNERGLCTATGSGAAAINSGTKRTPYGFFYLLTRGGDTIFSQHLVLVHEHTCIMGSSNSALLSPEEVHELQEQSHFSHSEINQCKYT